MKPSQGIGIGIGIGILIFVIILGLNVYAISNLQFRAQSIEDFSIFPELKMNMNMETCNPTFFPASYKAIYLDVYYKQNNLGTATMYGSTIPPGTNMPTKGNIDLDSGSVLGSIIDAIGSALAGSTPSTNDVKFKIKLDAPILGIIPFTLEKQYSYNEFSRLLEGGNNYGCSIQNPIPNFGEIESQFENQINSLQSALDETYQQIESIEIPIEGIVEESETEIEEEIVSPDDELDIQKMLQYEGKNNEKINELFDLGKKYYDLKDCEKSDYYFKQVLELTYPSSVRDSLAQVYINLNSVRCS